MAGRTFYLWNKTLTVLQCYVTYCIQLLLRKVVRKKYVRILKGVEGSFKFTVPEQRFMEI